MPGRPRKTVETAPVKETVIPKTILIHFVNEANVLGYTWLPGQELEVEEGSPEYVRSLDRDGKSCLTLTEDEQVERWGKVHYRTGESTIPNSLICYTVDYRETRNWLGVSNMQGWSNSEDYLRAAAEKELARGRKFPKD